MNGKNVLVIGGTGLLGHSVSNSLICSGLNVRVFSRDTLPDSIRNKNIEYIEGDMFSETLLKKALKDVDKVFYFLSTTFPKDNKCALQDEIILSQGLLEHTIQSMLSAGVQNIIFPSSGGTVYGDIPYGCANEDMVLDPSTSYGAGKVLCEQMLKFYCKKGLSTLILRIGNVYGSPIFRTQPQGVIDIFIQKALLYQPITIWGNAEALIRDYIFLDDFSNAVKIVSEKKYDEKFQVFNISSGIGTSLKEIIEEIKICTNVPITIEYIEDNVTKDINRVVLDISKIKSLTSWKPSYELHRGIKTTVERKKINLNN
jgi:UDP-glucose 4-epimerase